MPESKPFDNKALADFREKHFHELEECLRVSAEIRDDPEASPRERNTAIRNIAAMLGALTEKSSVSQQAKAKVRIDAPEHDANKDELEAILRELR